MDLAVPKFFPPHKVTPKPATTDDEGVAEGINVEVDVTAQDEHEYSGKTATQIEDGVKELFKGTAVNHQVERNDGDDVVPSFIDGFRLLPHQVQARQWMKERETGRSHGGILADDMGSIFFLSAILQQTKLLPGSAKPSKPSSESSKGNPTLATRVEDSSRQPCRSRLTAAFPELTTNPG